MSSLFFPYSRLYIEICIASRSDFYFEVKCFLVTLFIVHYAFFSCSLFLVILFQKMAVPQPFFYRKTTRNVFIDIFYEMKTLSDSLRLILIFSVLNIKIRSRSTVNFLNGRLCRHSIDFCLVIKYTANLVFLLFIWCNMQPSISVLNYFVVKYAAFFQCHRQYRHLSVLGFLLPLIEGIGFLEVSTLRFRSE